MFADVKKKRWLSSQRNQLTFEKSMYPLLKRKDSDESRSWTLWTLFKPSCVSKLITM